MYDQETWFMKKQKGNVRREPYVFKEPCIYTVSLLFWILRYSGYLETSLFSAYEVHLPFLLSGQSLQTRFRSVVIEQKQLSLD